MLCSSNDELVSEPVIQPKKNSAEFLCRAHTSVLCSPIYDMMPPPTLQDFNCHKIVFI